MANTLKFGAGKWATANGTALAYNDENNNFKPLPFTFTRASKATVVNQSGLIEEVSAGDPRIDFQGNTKGALLLEPSRTNLIPYSQDIITGWSTIRVTVQNNQTISPDGVLNAALSTATSDSGSHASFETLNGVVTSGNNYYISCFVKKSTTRYIRLNEGYVNDVVTFDLDTQTFVITQGSPTDVIFEDYGNGWYRIGYKFVAHSSGNTQFVLYINDNNNNISYSGNGEAIYLWGVQIEAGSYATSYIPTSGSAVTRVNDNCNRNSLQTGILGSNTGTSYFEGFKSIEAVFINVVLTAQANTTKSFLIDTSSSAIRLRVWNASSSSQATITTSAVSIGKFKYLIKWNATNLKVFCNGSLVGSGSFTAYPYSTLNLIEGASFSNNKLSDIKLYNTEITDSEAIALTTI